MSKIIKTINGQKIEFEKIDEVWFVTSLSLTRLFDKEHKAILRQIRKITESPNIGNKANGCILCTLKTVKTIDNNIKNCERCIFCTYQYKAKNGLEKPMMLINLNAFLIMILRYNSTKNIAMKIDSIKAVNEIKELEIVKREKEKNNQEYQEDYEIMNNLLNSRKEINKQIEEQKALLEEQNKRLKSNNKRLESSNKRLESSNKQLKEVLIKIKASKGIFGKTIKIEWEKLERKFSILHSLLPPQ